jgi:hypothetical protein
MDRFQAFLDCNGQEASCYLSDNKVIPAGGGKLCGFHENSNLFLCDSCLEYWKECDKYQIQAIWEFALERRRNSQGKPRTRKLE